MRFGLGSCGGPLSNALLLGIAHVQQGVVCALLTAIAGQRLAGLESKRPTLPATDPAGRPCTGTSLGPSFG